MMKSFENKSTSFLRDFNVKFDFGVWMQAGPEISRLLSDFEHSSEEDIVQLSPLHHEQGEAFHCISIISLYKKQFHVFLVTVMLF